MNSELPRTIPGRPATLRQRLMSSPLARGIKRAAYGRFAKLQHDTQGMLSPAVYKKIYERSRDGPDLDTIEVGGASGSASIAFAWGKIDSGKTSRHIVVEKMEGGTRRRYGGFEDNLDRFNRHLAELGAADPVVLFPHHLSVQNSPELVGLVRTERIAGFMSDADGRIDRDFRLFLPILHEDGFIIVDDYHPNRSWKEALTFRLLNRFIEWGLFVLEETRSGTTFGHSPHGADVSRIDPISCADIIESVRVDFGIERDSEIARLYLR